MFDCRKSTELQEHRITVPANGKVIHVRLLLPTGGAEVSSIEFQNESGKPLKSWRFGK